MIEQILTGTSAGVVAGVLSSWLMKVWAGRIQQRDRIHYEEQLQTRLQERRTLDEQTLVVHRVQFEKEFEVYLGLWGELLKVGRAASEIPRIGARFWQVWRTTT